MRTITAVIVAGILTLTASPALADPDKPDPDPPVFPATFAECVDAYYAQVEQTDTLRRYASGLVEQINAGLERERTLRNEQVMLEFHLSRATDRIERQSARIARLKAKLHN